MDDAEPAPPGEPAPDPLERVAKGRRPVQVKAREPEPSPQPKTSPKKRSKARKAGSEPALEPIRKRPRSGEQAIEGGRTPSGRWGESARPPRAPVSEGALEQALSWMDSAETRPLPEAPAPTGERPRTGKVEAVLSWMDDLSGPFEDVTQRPRPGSGTGAPPRKTSSRRAPAAAPAGSSEERRPTGKLKREAVSELLARADRVKQSERRPAARPAPAPPPSPRSTSDADLGPPEEGFGPLSASDVWLLAQTPEDVLAGAKRPQAEPPRQERPARLDRSPTPAPVPPLPPPLPARVSPPPPRPDSSDLERATKRAKVEEILEWTQDLLGAEDSESGELPLALEESGSGELPLALDDSCTDERAHAERAARATDVFEIELDLPDDDPPEPTPPSKRSSRLLRLQEQLRARGELDVAPSWSTLPDTDALSRLQQAAQAALAPDPFENDPLADLDPFAAVLPPAQELPRDPRCRDPFCMDPRCLQGAHGLPSPPAVPKPPKARIVRPGEKGRTGAA